MSRGKFIALIIITVIITVMIAGTGVYVYQLKTAAENISIESATIAGLDVVDGLMPSMVIVTLRFDVNNPTPYDVVIEKMYYNVYVEGELLGKGVEEDIYIPANSVTPVDFTLEIPVGSLASLVWNAIKGVITGEGILHYEIKGKIIVPVKLFGSVSMTSVEVPYNYAGVYETTPGASERESIKKKIRFGWEKTTAYVGETVYAYVDVYGPFDGIIKVTIKQDLTLLPDKVVLEKQYTVNVYENDRKTIKIAFTPSEPSSNILRGYFIVVDANGVVLEQESSYPPRLRVYEKPVTTTTTPLSGPPVGEGVLSILDISWIVNGHTSTQCSRGDTVTVTLHVEAQGGRVSGTITIYVKKDIALMPDQVLESRSYTINLYPGEETTLSLTFTVPDSPGGAIRGYFIEIYFDNEKIYTMENTYPPRLKLS